jgi:hypothetical protein
MTSGNTPITEAEIEAKWLEISPLIDRMMERVGTESEFPVSAGSSLSGDDKESAPYQVSHCVRMCLTAGVDHLHAEKALIVDHHLLHIAAPFSLSRGALENFAAAFWILHPNGRNDRIERALRWYAKNFKDQERAVGSLALQGHTPLEGKLQKLEAIAAKRGITTSIRGGYTSTEAVTYANDNAGVALGLYLPWQICSGFAHGRPWAYLGTSGLEEQATADPSVQNVKMTANLGTVLLPALAALRLLEKLLRIYTKRADTALDHL